MTQSVNYTLLPLKGHYAFVIAHLSAQIHFKAEYYISRTTYITNTKFEAHSMYYSRRIVKT